MKNILIVEDNIAIGRLIETNLELYGYSSERVLDAESAIKLLHDKAYDLILLDVMLPKISGFELLKLINTQTTPVIMLTALDTVPDKVMGLKLGADDYITKPFESMELIARIEAVLRRYEKKDDVLCFEHIELDTQSYVVKSKGTIINLTAKEYALLKYFIENTNVVLTREQILNKIWDYDFVGGSRTVDLHIKRIRTKADLYDAIKTVHRVGYILKSGVQ